MKLIADLHLHSKYSRATSRELDLEHINEWCRIKGIDIVATADFTHPSWFKEIKNKLETPGNGFYYLKDASDKRVHFVLSTEISCIYSKNNKTRRIHLVVLSPDLKTVEEINGQLNLRGNLKSDGRPILGMDAKELTKIILDVNLKNLVIPAHIWTPWFSLYGSESGFDKIEECFEELTPQIYAIETGLSSDPAMNWRIKELDNITILSNSDAHSLANLGREANVFDLEKVSYDELYQVIKEKNTKKFLYTIEFFPEEGKYHWDGHRACDLRLSPKETIKHKGICPKCKKSLTVGVMHRVEKLATRPDGEKPAKAVPFKSLVPLEEIIAESLSLGRKTKGVEQEYNHLIKSLGPEFKILLETDIEEIKKYARPRVAEGIQRVREGRITVIPGYDGVYGTVKVFDKAAEARQRSLF